MICTDNLSLSTKIPWLSFFMLLSYRVQDKSNEHTTFLTTNFKEQDFFTQKT